MTYIEEYKEGNKFFGIYLCKSKQILKTKAGKTYYSLLLQDKTGIIDAKVWELNNGIDDFDSMDFIMTDGMVTSFQGSRQVNVSRIRKAQEGEYDPAEYIPSSKYDREEMYQELLGFIKKIKNPYMAKLVNSFFVEDEQFIKRFQYHSAAKTVHHGFIGGLLEHTLGVTKLCDYFVKNYPMLQYDLLIPAALFHDIGKMWEISTFPENDYTDDGQLLGHIAIGYEMVGNRIKTIEGFPTRTASELKHCILSHHGELEYGSPKKPALIEAMALNFADIADDKLEMMTELLNAAKDNNDWLGFNRFADSNIRKTTKME